MHNAQAPDIVARIGAALASQLGHEPRRFRQTRYTYLARYEREDVRGVGIDAHATLTRCAVSDVTCYRRVRLDRCELSDVRLDDGAEGLASCAVVGPLYLERSLVVRRACVRVPGVYEAAGRLGGYRLADGRMRYALGDVYGDADTILASSYGDAVRDALRHLRDAIA